MGFGKPISTEEGRAGAGAKARSFFMSTRA
jgi:hypothetical protein